MRGGRVRIDEMPVVVRRSARRRKTVSARVEEGRLVVMLPEGLASDEEARWVERMRARLQAGERRNAAVSDDALARRAREVSRRWLIDPGTPTSVRWVGDQRSRWASCTPATGEIRVSRRCAAMPGWVLDYLLLHEVAHLRIPGHGARFWAAMAAYPQLERARGYLQGYAAAAAHAGSPEVPPEGSWATPQECDGHPEQESPRA